MIKTTRPIFLLPAFLLLAACGFHPVYGTGTRDDGTPVVSEMNDVAIESIANRDGQTLRNDLIDRMYRKGRSELPAYHLKVTIRSNEEDLGILANATSTRLLLNMYGDYKLTDAKGKVLVEGTAHSVASYDRLDQMYGTVAAQQDAHERTLHEVGEQIVNRLSLYFSERK